jgi:hypothetical protein
VSEIMSSQKMKRVCDACGAEKEWELIGVTEQAIQEMQEWYLITRKVIMENPMTGRPEFTSISANACALPCVPAAAIKLALPKPPKPEAEIDLESLRAANRPN